MTRTGSHRKLVEGKFPSVLHGVLGREETLHELYMQTTDHDVEPGTPDPCRLVLRPYDGHRTHEFLRKFVSVVRSGHDGGPKTLFILR